MRLVQILLPIYSNTGAPSIWRNYRIHTCTWARALAGTRASRRSRWPDHLRDHSGRLGRTLVAWIPWSLESHFQQQSVVAEPL